MAPGNPARDSASDTKSNDGPDAESSDSLRAKAIESLDTKSSDSLQAKATDGLDAKTCDNSHAKSTHGLRAQTITALRAAAIAALRTEALETFRAGLRAALPESVVAGALVRTGGRDGGRPVIAGRPLAKGGRLLVLAVGKAAAGMTRGLSTSLSPEELVHPGLVLTHDGGAVGWPQGGRDELENRDESENRAKSENNDEPEDRDEPEHRDEKRPDSAPLRSTRGSVPRSKLRFLEAGHPVPDARGEVAAREFEAAIDGLSRNDAVLVLVSGGSSSLLAAPAEGVSLEDKQEVTRLLLRAGADIRELNCVRKHLSRLKGGGLAARVGARPLEAWILSDVVGDDPSVIASGLTAPDPTSFGDALEVLESRGVLETTPLAVRHRLESGRRGELPETPKPGDPLFESVTNRILGSGRQSREACRKFADDRGRFVRVLAPPLEGEARLAARRFLASARAVLSEAPIGAPIVFLAAGETTVQVRGDGLGGRNQEFALAFALAMTEAPLGREWVLLAAGSDGRDGPTDAAGAVVDAHSIARGLARGRIAAEDLERNDSYRFLDAAGDLLHTGPTGTNVADLAILLIG